VIIMNTRMLVATLWIPVLIVSACAPAQPAATATPRPPTPVASNAAWTPVIQDFDGVEMVRVPAGCFEMGHAQGRRDEQPTHTICFDAPFWIDRYEVTNAQYGQQGNFPGDNRPRENLTWFEARDFCASRGSRLPTEAEWEYAASGPDNLIYPWGNELIEDNLVFDRNSNNQTADVGSRPGGVSWVGAYDMAGNVFEWVSSQYRPYPYSATDGRENLDDTQAQRVYRGGVGSYIDYGVSTATRFRKEPDSRDWFLGFRCARDA
jgi:formylglycine-generating enzyme required for sulfatase activity